MKHACLCSSQPCGCIDLATPSMTPLSNWNRPGLSSLRYRVGNHAAFFNRMQQRLSDMAVQTGDDSENVYYPLQGLSTRDTSDPAIALLDAWASASDVLTFYQERIANEGYLRTATERRSILEMARLVGYELKPGVAASVYLAYTMDKNQAESALLPIGTRAQSIAGPDETAQSFETTEELVARADWNNLRPRSDEPQNIVLSEALSFTEIYLSGISTNLKIGDSMLLHFAQSGDISVMRKVAKVEAQAASNRTKVTLASLPDLLHIVAKLLYTLAQAVSYYADYHAGQTLPVEAQKMITMVDYAMQQTWLGNLVPLQEVVATARLWIKLGKDKLFAPQEAAPASFAASAVAIGTPEPSGGPVISTPDNLLDIRISTPLPAELNAPYVVFQTAVLAAVKADMGQGGGSDSGAFTEPAQFINRLLMPNVLQARNRQHTQYAWLDGAHEAILDSSLAVISAQGADPNGRSRPVRAAFNVTQATTQPRTAYGVSGKSTRLHLDRDWWVPSANTQIDELRATLVQAQSEQLSLALAPVDSPIHGQEITLDGLYAELESGRWIILSGERADITGVSNVKVAELLMISGLRQEYNPNLPGDSIHTTLILATNTAYQYKRDTITIYGNVVKASHGETRVESLGSGNGAASMQSFVLKQAPVTFVSSNSRDGVASTLSVQVDNITWHETDCLAGTGPNARQFVTKIDNDGKTTVCFGNGVDGARLPTGAENIKAVYRQGLGAAGNVRAGQISMLMSRPLGVREVINPLRASGGADHESASQARNNVPLAVMALDRLVSLQDYGDFARTFGGIGKALVARVSDGKRPVVHVTIAGSNDAPIDDTSDLYRNLLAALRSFGDPDLPLVLQVRELMLMVINARIKILPDYSWEVVEANVRRSLLDTFSFDKRALGQPALLCEVIAAMQNVAGVEYIDIENYGGIPEKMADGESGTRRLLTLDELAHEVEVINDPAEYSSEDNTPRVPPAVPANQAGLEAGAMRPAQLILATSLIADTIILNQIV
ncbi:MAG: putative baseplate assembly protein [Burkholderiales bacterium]|nr:putative baseplate assembly protein [Burkholderiales bacterium]